VEIEVLDEAELRRLGMGALVGVGQGSPRGSRLLLVTWRGADGPPLALVGKGITFDSGGLSLKTSSGMADMKGDMSGAAAVVGTVLSLARTRAPVHVVAVAALAENMPDGNAQRVGDVVRTISGKTIEIVNTDAEGRLVLADAVQYVAERKEPFAIVDIATLTGAAVSALGPEYAGLFTREDAIAERIAEVAERAGEPVWRLPLHPDYAKAVRSDIADVKNSGTSPAPGASAGAHFIEAFIAEDMPWAHIDMAPTMWADSAGPVTPKGPTGYGVRLLDLLAREWRAASLPTCVAPRPHQLGGRPILGAPHESGEVHRPGEGFPAGRADGRHPNEPPAHHARALAQGVARGRRRHGGAADPARGRQRQDRHR